jgi:hypothetical protein
VPSTRDVHDITSLPTSLRPQVFQQANPDAGRGDTLATLLRLNMLLATLQQVSELLDGARDSHPLYTQPFSGGFNNDASFCNRHHSHNVQQDPPSPFTLALASQTLRVYADVRSVLVELTKLRSENAVPSHARQEYVAEQVAMSIGVAVAGLQGELDALKGRLQASSGGERSLAGDAKDRRGGTGGGANGGMGRDAEYARCAQAELEAVELKMARDIKRALVRGCASSRDADRDGEVAEEKRLNGLGRLVDGVGGKEEIDPGADQ